MNGLNYLLQSNLYLIIFFVFYWLLLRKETFNNYNRAYLVLSALVSFAIPLWNLDIVQGWFITQKTTYAIVQLNLPEYVFSNIETTKSFDITNYLSIVYVIGCSILAAKLIMNIFNLYRFINGNETLNKAFSFFHNIIISHGIDPDDVIYDHERVHARQYHSFDVILFEIIGIFCWFNPVIYLYKIAIKNIHEFIADDIASSKLSSKVEYAMLLFSEKFQTHPSVLVNNFFTKTSLKLRIEMLNKKRSNKVAILKYGLIFPMFLGMMVFASAFIANGENKTGIFDSLETKIVSGKIFTEDKKPIPGASIVIKGANRGTTSDINGNFKIKLIDAKDVLVVSHIGYESQEIIVGEQTDFLIVFKNKLNGLAEVVITAYPNSNFQDSIKIEKPESQEIKGEIFTVGEQNAEYPGGQQEMYKFIQRNLRYPKEAQANNVQGKVFAKFVVDTRGEISNIRILKGMGSGLDEEAVRVIGKMPNWEPATQNGKVVNSEFAMPLSFVLEGGKIEKPISKPEIPNDNLKFEATPIYYLDGVEISLAKVKTLDESKIQSVDVLKGDIAIKKYGEKGRNGVVAINTKNSAFKKVQDSDEVFTMVDENAEFPGGQTALGKYIIENLKYPAPALRANVQGKVFLSFVVSKTGETSDVQVIKGLGFGLDEEAIRLVKAMPKWKPAKQSGHAVNSKFNLPISFVLDQKEFDKIDSASGKEYLYIIDGKKVSYEYMKKIKLGKHKLQTLSEEEAMKKHKVKKVVIIQTLK